MRWLSRARVESKELLDAPSLPADELQQNLDDLRRLNLYLGSRYVILAAMKRLWRQAGRPDTWCVVDIGTGAGDVPAALTRWGRRHGIHVRVIAVDIHQDVLRYTKVALQHDPNIELCQADGLHLPFRPGTFDVAICSSTVHHLTWSESVSLLHVMAEVTRYGIIVNDLRRSSVWYYVAKGLLHLVSANRLTRHDGPLSVLRAYTINEVCQIAAEAALASVEVRSRLLYRWLLISTHRGVGRGC